MKINGIINIVGNSIFATAHECDYTFSIHSEDALGNKISLEVDMDQVARLCDELPKGLINLTKYKEFKEGLQDEDNK